MTYKSIRDPVDRSQIHDILDNIKAPRGITQKREGLLMDEGASLGLNVSCNRAGMLDIVEESQLNRLAMGIHTNIIQQREISE